MSYPTRAYPLTGSIWIYPRNPTSGPADITNVPMQLYVNPKIGFYVWSSIETPNPFSWFVWIFLPEGVWTRHRLDVFQPDHTVAEYYLVAFSEHFYKGFSNSYRGALTLQCNANGTTPATY